MVTGVGEVGALLICGFGVGDVEGVVLLAATHRHVGPFPVGVPVDNHERTVGGDTLGLVTRHCVPVVDMTSLEIPDREVSGFGVTVETDRQTPVLAVDVGDGGEVTVE